MCASSAVFRCGGSTVGRVVRGGLVTCGQVVGECGAGTGEMADVGVEVALGGGDLVVSGDVLEDVEGDTGVGHPGQSGVAEVVAA